MFDFSCIAIAIVFIVYFYHSVVNKSCSKVNNTRVMWIGG